MGVTTVTSRVAEIGHFPSTVGITSTPSHHFYRFHHPIMFIGVLNSFTISDLLLNKSAINDAVPDPSVQPCDPDGNQLNVHSSTAETVSTRLNISLAPSPLLSAKTSQARNASHPPTSTPTTRTHSSSERRFHPSVGVADVTRSKVRDDIHCCYLLASTPT